jgi:hypothetical protein
MVKVLDWVTAPVTWSVAVAWWVGPDAPGDGVRLENATAFDELVGALPQAAAPSRRRREPAPHTRPTRVRGDGRARTGDRRFMQ